MATTALDRTSTLDRKNLAIQVQQLQDNSGNAVDVTELTNSSGSAQFVAGGATLTLVAATHNKKTILLDTAGGTVVTLPAATGSGAVFKFIVTVLATSASHKVQVANANDAMIGIIKTMSDDPATVKAFAAASTSDTITLNRTTTGSVSKGEWLEVIDIAANVFFVRGMTSSTGTEATPFSAAV